MAASAVTASLVFALWPASAHPSDVVNAAGAAGRRSTTNQAPPSNVIVQAPPTTVAAALSAGGAVVGQSEVSLVVRVDHQSDHGTAEHAVQPLSRPVVVLYGDSLAWEARADFAFAFAGQAGVQVIERTFGGTAICDYLAQMAADAKTLAPGAVVVEFSGNNLTPCMQDAAGQLLGGAAYLQRYTSDAETVISTFAASGTQVVFAGAPISRSQAENPDFKGGGLNTMYARMAATHAGVRYVDAGTAVLDNGQWTETLPCMAGEPCTGGVDAAGRTVNVVRAPDGGHFCPASAGAVRGVTGDCPVWSSGAFRYGMAMAEPVIEAIAVSAFTG